MTLIPPRAVHWVNRWSDHGLLLGRHDGAGNPIFEYEAGDAVAADLIAELQADDIMRHGITLIILAMVVHAAKNGGFE